MLSLTWGDASFHSGQQVLQLGQRQQPGQGPLRGRALAQAVCMAEAGAPPWAALAAHPGQVAHGLHRSLSSGLWVVG